MQAENYSTKEREMLGIVWGIIHFRPYLYGRKFTIITDHKPLSFLHSLKEPKGREARWLQELAQYDFDVAHQPGLAHVAADALSRLPDRSSTAERSKLERATANERADNVFCGATGWEPQITRDEIDHVYKGPTPS